MLPKLIVYRTAEKPPLWIWNRYGSRTIGAAVRVPGQRCLSLQWRRP